MYWLESNSAEPCQVLQPNLLVCRKKGLLLIDDDEWFRAVFRVVCEAKGIPLTTYSSLAEMPSFAALKDYDVAILDYYLESFRGPEIAEYIDVFFSNLPVVMISGSVISECERQSWPQCIRRFKCKSSGPYAILECALDLMKDPWPEPAKAANLN